MAEGRRWSEHEPLPAKQLQLNVPLSPLKLISAVFSLTVTSAPDGIVTEWTAGAAWAPGARSAAEKGDKRDRECPSQTIGWTHHVRPFR